MLRQTTLIFLLLFGINSLIDAQTLSLSGQVTNENNGKPVEFASVLLKESSLWAITDTKGKFTIKNIPRGKTTIIVRCLGFATCIKELSPDTIHAPLRIRLSEDNLRLKEVEVTATRKHDDATTSYIIDRLALDNQQAVNISDIMSLLPGGKTINSTLMNDDRIALRSEGAEKGNASFGTAIEVDGVRMDNNAMTGETKGAGTRTISTANVESMEVVTGIPSVEYGDLSNGVVKINTRKGRSPFIVDGKINRHTRLIALNKGFDFGKDHGLLNFSLEHARSFSDELSPFTAYQRNVLSLHYMNVFMRNSTPLTFNLGITGNMGGYDSKEDPDNQLDDYTKARDNSFRGSFTIEWLLNKQWITNISLNGSLSYTDKLSERYSNVGSAATQAAIHTMEEGYFVATDFDKDPDANIILGPIGFWHERGFNDSKPMSFALKLKARQIKRFGKARNMILAGLDFTGSKNYGEGTYYEDMRYAPSWRPYRYKELPMMRNLALFLEDKVSIELSRLSTFELTAGIRHDITVINGSDYGTVSTPSPRVNGRFVLWRKRELWISDLSFHAGWGKSVKLPSFQVLYPSPSYRDKLAFTPGSTAENKAYYAYYTHPSKAMYNPELKWQYTNQTDIGMEMNVKGTRISVSGFYHKTFLPYMSACAYTPYTYKYTSQREIERINIPSKDRQYAIDRQTGVVTVSDITGEKPAVQLDYNERKSFLVNTTFTNGSPTNRYGLEWIVDFAPIKALNTSIRLDGKYYCYKGLDDGFFADVPLGLNIRMYNGQPYGYIGYYRGSGETSTSYTANASVSNGAESKHTNLNATFTTHIPRIRMVVALRVECSLYNYGRSLCELPDGPRGLAVENMGEYFGIPYTKDMKDTYVVVYPEYYSTWEAPDERIPFAEKFKWAKENDRHLYNELVKLVVSSNYPFMMNPDKLSKYYSANVSVTKEIGDHVTVSFYANNFWNTMRKIKSSRTGMETSLFGSGYIPSFYYGLSLRLKI